MPATVIAIVTPNEVLGLVAQEVIVHVIKSLNLNTHTTPCPIKATQSDNNLISAHTNIGTTSSEVDTDASCSEYDKEEAKTTVVIAAFIPTEQPLAKIMRHKSGQVKNNLIKVLLDSGSDGDLWFHKKGNL